MKRSDLQKIRGQSIKQLYVVLEKRKKEVSLDSARMDAGKLKNLKKVKTLKKDISQMLTIVKEKEIMQLEEKKSDSEKLK